MSALARCRSGQAAPAPAKTDLLDFRFRALIPEAQWASLPEAVRRRFSKRLPQGASAVYVGQVVSTRMSLAGWLLAQATRIIGSPLPLSRAAGMASVVSVTEDPQGGGQIWTRLYARPSGFPQMIHSAKRFTGPTGLEEHIGAGIGMRLSVGVEDRALVFRSRGYFFDVFGPRLVLPAWLSPGALSVTHAATSADAFRFTLDLRHPLLGPLIRQEAEFRDSKPLKSEL
ncbi:DUF4166 domain-containing protein [Methylobacterium gnaphalii]|uniref:DUF4166 domain-containing protein n=1 Tax=Methylobacterium gnaphalii TaxID=1010610 RepID=A0A512JPU8_9HYPH|nr:DUF4166 domain-containing protein [Methylobacterium gnaphalii]GEP11990.1 hypothetical protein MGN01_38350 [Methylobacterium gnaphalii]GJD68661.1 hypothetical protein MMMDOFMJ_1585 [Methylobacterium gnaphalii]GLS49442.1 hypothetical protein GCM10007885_22900 [Methylobacterium gnaphalii]